MILDKMERMVAKMKNGMVNEIILQIYFYVITYHVSRIYHVEMNTTLIEITMLTEMSNEK